MQDDVAIVDITVQGAHEPANVERQRACMHRRALALAELAAGGVEHAAAQIHRRARETGVESDPTSEMLVRLHPSAQQLAVGDRRLRPGAVRSDPALALADAQPPRPHGARACRDRRGSRRPPRPSAVDGARARSESRHARVRSRDLRARDAARRRRGVATARRPRPFPSRSCGLPRDCPAPPSGPGPERARARSVAALP